MAEIAASAAGIISLGIESCKLIVTYCDAWQSFDNDIDAAKVKTEGLLSILNLILWLLCDPSLIQSAISVNIAAKIVENEKWIGKVNECVAKLSIGQNPSLRDRIRSAGKRIAYPFRKQTLLDTVSTLERLQMNLHTALLALQIEQISSLAKQTMPLHAAYARGFMIDRARQAYQEPRFLEGPLKQSDSLQSDKPRCLCPGVDSPPGIHHRTCPHYDFRSQASYDVWDFVLSNRWLGLSVRGTVFLTSGARGFSICPTIHFHPIVSRSSPVLQLLMDRLYEPGESTRAVLRELQILFDTGKASPFDRTEEGWTLLHLACARGCLRACAQSTTFDMEVIEFLVTVGCPINEGPMKNLEIIRGPRFFCPGTYTPLSLLVYIIGSDALQDYEDTIFRFIKLGAMVGDSHMTSHNSITAFSDAMLQNEDAFVLSDPVSAVLDRSADGLKQMIDCDKGAPGTGVNQLHSPADLLYLSLGWAQGFRVLLGTYLDVPVEVKIDLLHDAIECDPLDTAQALVDHGTPISSLDIEACDSEEMELLIMGTFIERRRQLMTLAMKFLPKQRQDKLGMRGPSLPDRNAARIYAELKTHAVVVHESLEPLGPSSVFHIPWGGCDRLETLYQQGFHDINVITDAGYSPVLDPSYQPGCCGRKFPILLMSNIMWFIEKGANLRIPLNMNHTTAHHILALKMVSSAAVYPFPGILPTTFLPTFVDCMRSVLGLKCRDTCSCFCSASGCSPLDVAFRALLATKSPIDQYQTIPPEVLESYIAVIQNRSQSSEIILRLLTFTDLGLTHTCCRLIVEDEEIGIEPFDTEDAEEIHEEERFYLWHLEVLIEELVKQYQDLSIPLWEYIQCHWSLRIREYLLEHGEVLSPDSLCVRLSRKIIEEQ